MVRFFSFFLMSALLSLSAHAGAPETFRQAKTAMKKVYADNPVTAYCNCQYKKVGKKLVPEPKTCGYEPRKPITRSGKPNARAERIEWEHVMPAWVFGHQMQCWQTGGRKGCKGNPKFERMEADMRNLVPAIGELNGDRSNYRMGEIAGEARVYGACNFEVDFKQRVVEPPESFKGDVARTYFYMSNRYGLRLSKQQIKLFEAWDRMDPVSSWEMLREARIRKFQGGENPFVHLK